ncbi:hypothetical protein KPH14_007427 [Odynerus spinipes]|uniref:Uncharacterized protein n=1 Tax=Odynerus spinipes TaxID=1348599 RepID=A0AAD9VJM1_9HYME|nr:hypothetical protein KPH14_007427 [Odynerus spinipes]
MSALKYSFHPTVDKKTEDLMQETRNSKFSALLRTRSKGLEEESTGRRTTVVNSVDGQGRWRIETDNGDSRSGQEKWTVVGL